ncbi:hypothetical protein [Novosphingobium decolorationis]|uniref:hypothetical protein n=1 Tax=Novosphingobium decolorationis TaxID=2698673 RepID=UPI001BCD748A|nr:hypothetical protein [Novosphingobium decolorationis]
MRPSPCSLLSSGVVLLASRENRPLLGNLEEDVMTLVEKSIGFAAALGICALGFALTLA